MWELNFLFYRQVLIDGGFGRPGIFLIDTVQNPNGKGSVFPKRRKSDAATLGEDDTSPHQSICGRNGRSKLNEDPHGPIFEIREWAQERNTRNGMRAPPRFSQNGRSEIGSEK